MTIDKSPRSQGEFDNSHERYEFCRKLAPKIIGATDNYFSIDRPHPYLDGLANGGIITSHPELDTEDTEYLTIVNATGLRDTIEPEKFERIGIPEEIASSGQMWVVMKDDVEYEKDLKKSPTQRKSTRISHCFAYWDGTAWQASRLKPGADENGPWEDKWETTHLTTEEMDAISTVATQTQDVQSIAEVFEGDSHAFRRVYFDVLMYEYGIDEETARRFTDYSLGGFHPSEAPTTYSLCHRTAYQSSNLINTAYKLSRRNSKLDSGNITDALYYAPSMPLTSDMIENGVDIPQGAIHPPVPAGFIQK